VRKWGDVEPFQVQGVEFDIAIEDRSIRQHGGPGQRHPSRELRLIVAAELEGEYATAFGEHSRQGCNSFFYAVAHDGLPPVSATSGAEPGTKQGDSKPAYG
jgi:hypothetical protein